MDENNGEKLGNNVTYDQGVVIFTAWRSWTSYVACEKKGCQNRVSIQGSQRSHVNPFFTASFAISEKHRSWIRKLQEVQINACPSHTRAKHSNAQGHAW
jgi:hypothetical protein